MQEHTKKNWLSNIGTALITLSFIGFIFLFYPIIIIYLFPPKVVSVTAVKGTYITIPAIYAQAPVVEGVDPWDQEAYNNALKKGVAHAKGTFLPGGNGTTFIFAHSSGNPFEASRYNTIFYRLGELVKGDEIVILRNGKRLVYKVREKKEVWPTEVQYLKDTRKKQLILQTCTPIGTNLKRLLVFADPVE